MSDFPGGETPQDGELDGLTQRRPDCAVEAAAAV